MTAVDILKALGVAIGILIVNVAISFGVVALYSAFVDPGHPEAYYQKAAAAWLAPWSSIAFGWLLFFFAIRLVSRNPTRDALTFALTAFGIYAAIDLGLIASVGRLAEFGPIIGLSLSTKLVGAVAGVWAAGR
jgi:hypothetical protein